jgi:hypothetical protein
MDQSHYVLTVDQRTILTASLSEKTATSSGLFRKACIELGMAKSGENFEWSEQIFGQLRITFVSIITGRFITTSLRQCCGNLRQPRMPQRKDGCKVAESKLVLFETS